MTKTTQELIDTIAEAQDHHEDESEMGQLLQELSDKLKEQQWRPIETAPKAEIIMVIIPFDEEHGGYHFHVAAFWKSEWYVAGQIMKTPPTHWTQKPKQPKFKERFERKDE